MDMAIPVPWTRPVECAEGVSTRGPGTLERLCINEWSQSIIGEDSEESLFVTYTLQYSEIIQACKEVRVRAQGLTWHGVPGA